MQLQRQSVYSAEFAQPNQKNNLNYINFRWVGDTTTIKYSSQTIRLFIVLLKSFLALPHHHTAMLSMKS